jgi:uncharacterized membrane protein YraQ (UPF0718 family)
LNPTLLLAIATLALVVGPLLDRLARRVPWVPALIDGATVGGIVVVSFFHLLPEAGMHLGWWALPLLAVGLALPAIAEKLIEHGTERLRVPIGVLVVLLLLAHEVIESAALASKAAEERVGIATLLVVVGHRLPLGLFLWGQTKRRFGRVGSVAALAAVAGLTWFGPVIVKVEAEMFGAVLSALLAGGLLHLVLGHGPANGVGEREHRHVWSAIGMVAAIAFFVPYLVSGVAPHGHEHAVDAQTTLPERLRELVFETSPTLLVGVIAAALIEAFLPGSIPGFLSRGSRLRRALSGVAIGAPLPVCSCGILPIYRSLIRKGIGPTAGLALLVAGPEIGVDSFLLSMGMLGTEATLARVGAALALALVVALVVGRIAESATPAEIGHIHELEDGEGAARTRSPLSAIRHGLLETWAHLSPWILLGLVLTAVVEPWISTEWALATPPWVQVLVLTLVGMPSYICATAATPFAAMLLDKGFAPGAVIAFLLTGPATNLTTFGALRRIHSTRVAVAFVVTALVATVLLGHAVDQWLSGAVATGEAVTVPHEHGLLAWGSAAVLGALTLWVLFQDGPRAYLARVWSVDPSGDHAHAHTQARQDA